MLGVNRSIFYFDSHGEINTKKTLELSRKRAEELRIKKIVIASETGLSALEALKIFKEQEFIVVSSAAGTIVEGSIIGDLKIGIPDESVLEKLRKNGVEVIRGTDPFWNLGAHTELIDTGKLGMMFYKVISSGLHVCMAAVLEATDSGYLSKGEEVISIAGSFVGLDTAIVASGSNSVNFFRDFEVLEIICKPRNPRYSWPINQVDWKGDLKKYERFVDDSNKS
jgi:hypothetical protein